MSQEYKYTYTYHDNNYYEDSIINYDYSGKTEPLECFTCHFSNTQDHNQGMKNCDEPFYEEGIPTINCDGSCAITNTSLGNKDYMIVRSCLPNCKDISDPASSVKCCSTTKCNGRTVRNMEMVTLVGGGSMMVVTMVIFCVLVCVKK